MAGQFSIIVLDCVNVGSQAEAEIKEILDRIASLKCWKVEKVTFLDKGGLREPSK